MLSRYQTNEKSRPVGNRRQRVFRTFRYFDEASRDPPIPLDDPWTRAYHDSGQLLASGINHRAKGREDQQPVKLQIIVGSTRPERAADRVAPWVVASAGAHQAFDVELLDLRDWPLPFFGESRATLGDIADPTYSDPIVKQWNQKIRAADAYIIVTPEYNHTVPGALKNALDTVWMSFAFRNKPVGFVAYSGGPVGGARAVEHLALIAVEAELVPMRNTVLIAQVQSAFGDDGQPVNPMTTHAMNILLDDVAWWGGHLARARAEGQLPPAIFRRPPVPQGQR